MKPVFRTDPIPAGGDTAHVRRRISAGRPQTVVIALLAFGLAACAQMPVKEGPRAQLVRGIETPRDRNDMDITIYKLPITAWPKCLEIVAKKNPILAVASALTLSVIHACAHVPRDKALKPGQRPWCIVAVPEGDDDALEHELRHCEGWDHPRTGGEESEGIYVDNGDHDSAGVVSASRDQRRE